MTLICYVVVILYHYLHLQLHVCESVLEDEGVFGLVAVRELQLDLFVLDSDFMSMEMPFLFRSFYLVCFYF